MKMVLQEILNRVPGALGAAVVGVDGIAVEKVATGKETNIDLLSAEGINVVKRAVSSMRDGGAGSLEELSITGQSRTVILRALGSDYYLCLVIGPETLTGRARYEVWKAGLQLQETLG